MKSQEPVRPVVTFSVDSRFRSSDRSIGRNRQAWMWMWMWVVVVVVETAAAAEEVDGVRDESGGVDWVVGVGGYRC
jgi:hypothetical protein